MCALLTRRGSRRHLVSEKSFWAHLRRKQVQTLRWRLTQQPSLSSSRFAELLTTGHSRVNFLSGEKGALQRVVANRRYATQSTFWARNQRPRWPQNFPVFWNDKLELKNTKKVLICFMICKKPWRARTIYIWKQDSVRNTVLSAKVGQMGTKVLTLVVAYALCCVSPFIAAATKGLNSEAFPWMTPMCLASMRPSGEKESKGREFYITNSRHPIIACKIKKQYIWVDECRVVLWAFYMNNCQGCRCENSYVDNRDCLPGEIYKRQKTVPSVQLFIFLVIRSNHSQPFPVSSVSWFRKEPFCK